MAGSLGSLIVTLGLDAAEFTTGLTKSEYEAKKFAQKVDRAIADGVKAAGAAFVTLGVAAAGAFAAISKMASDVGAFKDLEETTGANAEALASFAVAAGTAGVSMETVAGGMNKLTKGLVSVEDETKDAGAALEALGLNIQDFKKLDPATQMEEVAKALAGFEDGASKTAVAMALFGKSGAALLPFLKELAAEGGRQVILTQQQIERADAYADAQARARTQLQLFVQMLATEALPTITTITETAKEFIKQLLGIREEGGRLQDVGAKVREFSEMVATGFTRIIDVGDGVIRTFRVAAEVAASYAAQRDIPFWDVEGKMDVAREARRRIDAILMEKTATQRLTEAFKEAAKQRDLAAQEDRGFKPPGKRLAFTGKEAGGKAKEQVSEAQRYIEALEKQIIKTEELSATELARVEIAKFKKAATAEEERRIFALAAELDLQRAIKKEEEERKKVEAEAARAREQASKLQDKLIDDEFKKAEALRDENERIKENIVLLEGGVEAVRALEKARLANNLQLAEERLLMAQNAGASALEVEAIRQQVAALRERQELVGRLDLAEQMRIEADKLQNLKDEFSDALVGPLMDFVNQTKSAKDAFKSFIKSIQQLLQEKAARSLADYIFGGKTGSGFDLGTLFKLLSGSFGGLFGGGTSYIPGVLDSVPPVFGSFAQGGVSMGGRAWVGENGPELVTLPRGARVTPHRQSMEQTGRSLVFNVNVLPGADSRSAKQVGGVLRDTVVRAIKDR